MSWVVLIMTILLISFKNSKSTVKMLRKSSLRATSSISGMGAVRTTSQQSVRITTYNVLSSHLAEPDYFRNCTPAFLDANYRLKALKTKLNVECDKGAIICLQEVSISWLGPLHTFFRAKDYVVVSTQYGNVMNNFMGVAIAIPVSKYDIIDADVTRVADKIDIDIPQDESRKGNNNFSKGGHNRSNSRGVGNALRELWRAIFGGSGQNKRHSNGRAGNGNSNSEMKLSSEDEKIMAYWRDAENRKNQMICVRLQSQISSESQSGSGLNSFCIGTYHMPCAFRKPPMMMIHCALSAHHLHEFAQGDPYVFAGDFNIKPQGAMYNLLTLGKVVENDETLPKSPPGYNMPYNHNTILLPLRSPPMRSAYAVHDGCEPDFTNYAQVRGENPFIDTLDYIFVSDEWKIKSVLPLPNRDAMSGPLPLENEPSDHIMLSADLELNK
jgi:2',5'-phosphodiesterase